VVWPPDKKKNECAPENPHFLSLLSAVVLVSLLTSVVPQVNYVHHNSDGAHDLAILNSSHSCFFELMGWVVRVEHIESGCTHTPRVDCSTFQLSMIGDRW